MSDLTFNKIAGAALATGLAIVGLKEVSAGIFSPGEPPEKAGYAIQVAEADSGGAAAVELPVDWGTALPAADIKAGEAVFAKCKSCHTIENGGANGTGPGLWGILGHKPGSHVAFPYSPGMKDFSAKQPIWDYEHVYEFVKAPQKYIAGTKMTFVGLKKSEDRVNLIAYLHSMGSTLPIPAPNPAAAAAPAEVAAAAPAAAPGAASAPASTGAAKAEPAAKGEAAPAAPAAKH